MRAFHLSREVRDHVHELRRASDFHFGLFQQRRIAAGRFEQDDDFVLGQRRILFFKISPSSVVVKAAADIITLFLKMLLEMCCNDFWKRRMEQKKNERAGYVLMFRSSEVLLSLKLHTYFYHLC